MVATMRKPEKETKLDQLPNVLVTRLDVTAEESIKSAIKEGIDTFGRIDVLLNNAGYGAYGVLEATPLENIRRQFDTNVIGLLATTQAVIPHFRQNKSGTIINVSSVGGKLAFPLGTLYHGTKFAVEGLSDALSYEMEKIGVRVKIVEPGAIKTDFGTRSFDFSNDDSLDEYQGLVQSLFAAMEPMIKNAADATMCAKVIYQAATDESDTLRYIAGQDAEQFVALRSSTGDSELRKTLKEQFNL